MDNYYVALRTFILYNISILMFDELELPNISFDFKEKEAKEVIFKLIMNELKLNTESIKLSEADNIVKAINNPDYSKPVMEISDYKRFFTNLDKIINHNMDKLERENIIKYLWLRMTPDDFKHPEEFLEKNINILKDRTFNNYLVETTLDNEFFKDYTLTIRNLNSHFFNESMKEIKFTLIKDNIEYNLPVVRYGIYEKNNQKICEIGSIQHISNNFPNSEEIKLEKKIDRLKYKLNQDVDKELIEDIEPKNLISLLLFIRLLQDNGIKRISVPTMYPLDYEYHAKRVEMYKIFLKNRKNNTEKELNALSRIDRIDEISKVKTEDFIKLFERAMYHIEDSKIITYPGEVSNYLELEINSLDKINGENVKKLIKG